MRHRGSPPGAEPTRNRPLVTGQVVRIRGQRWRVARCIHYDGSAVVDVGGYDRVNRGIHTRFLLPIEHMNVLPASDVPRPVSPARWRHLARRVLAGAVPDMQSLRGAASSRIALIPFQLEPALAVTSGLGTRLLIADEVGLGKTIQAGVIVSELLHRHPDGRVLVVSPASLREQWAAELLLRFGLEGTALDAGAVMRAAAQLTPGANPWASSPLVIASIDYVKRPEVIRALEALVWDAVVFDEAHALAGNSERAAAATSLGRRARVLVLLSATPHSGDGRAFARLCAVGRLADDPLLVFRRTREDAGLTSARRTRWLRVRTSDAERTMHRALVEYARLVWSQAEERAGARLAMTVLLKRACSSPIALACSIERRLQLLAGHVSPVELQLALPLGGDTADDEPVATLAAPGLHDRAEETRQLRAILQLARSAAADSKTQALLRLVRRIREPAIVFTEYRDTLVHLSAVLPDAVLLHGGLTSAERREALHAFTGARTRLLLATDAASEGLNLHERCRLVVNLELPWTPIRLEQRVGRVDRFGQVARPHAVHLVGRGTPEERTVERLVRRDALARRALTPDAATCDEGAVARAVIEAPGDPSDVPASPALPPLPPGITFPRLLDAARQEAARLEGVRALGAGVTPIADESRPVITRLHRRRVAPAASYWAFRVPFVDSAGQVCWSTIAAAQAPPAQASLDRTGAHAVFEAIQGWLDDAWREGHWAMPAEAVQRASLWTRTALERERQIAGHLRHSRARLAVWQPGLFDRRQERARDAQQSVLDEALARCGVRVLGLERLERLAPGPAEPLFAVLSE